MFIARTDEDLRVKGYGFCIYFKDDATTIAVLIARRCLRLPAARLRKIMNDVNIVKKAADAEARLAAYAWAKDKTDAEAKKAAEDEDMIFASEFNNRLLRPQGRKRSS